MANIKQQEKRIRQNEKRRVKNVQTKSAVRTSAKKITKALEAKETKSAEELLQLQKNYIKTIDTASQKGVIHPKTAARKKSRLAKKVNAQVKQQA
ncbi:MAG TPA: 30S ribosomal protein S20 [Spirochaetota bacterium]|nr:30S ribosomal protein S20 [Spirochaetota bacterium]HPI89415.1 30S ribosomal protein S20 [Spirochaetota bacterium]HPR49625.1 30S ribosomal protein S20 [Spirochaetota bacterium]